MCCAHYAAARGKGAMTVVVLFVSLSVRRVYIANNSRTQRPSVPKCERKFPTFDGTCTPVSKTKGQRSRSPGSLMLTHIVRHIERQGLRTSNLLYGWRTTTRISHRRHDLQGQKSRSRDQSEPSWPNAVPLSLEAGGGIPCRPNPAATLLV